MKRVPTHLVKTHRSYTIEELADVLRVTKATVRRWCKDGLPCFTDAKPFLIQSGDLKAWYATNLAAKKVQLGAFEVYCLSCKKGREPDPDLIEIRPKDAKRDVIFAICPACGATMQRIIRRADSRRWAARYGCAANTRGAA
ncbi:MAG: helix-turn-helix domain-containing protein [Rhodobacteraceae bacterium]|nr:helix-turn-helix domain-containing protein [Paracoccaceae bacterium]